MTPRERLRAALDRCPLVAILRGITPDEIDAVAGALIRAGFAAIEVPLNSPDAYASIERLVRGHGDRALVGAGTVLSPAEVERLYQLGAQMIVSPDTNPEVIAATAARDMVSLPGYSTPTEAFAALRAGASGLKLFPAEAASPAILRAQRAVLPNDVPILAVGGIDAKSFGQWTNLAQGFGIGSALYRPGMHALDVENAARRLVKAITPPQFP